MTLGECPRYVLLDRDGVINKAPVGRYVTTVTEVSLLESAGPAIRALNDNGFCVLVVSNQQCVGLGLLRQPDLDEISDHIAAQIREVSGGEIREFFYCPHIADANCACRKPKPGLIHQARRKYQFETMQTYVVGDSYGDLEAARNAGCPSILVLTGNDAERYRQGDVPPAAPQYVAQDLMDAARHIIERTQANHRATLA